MHSFLLVHCAVCADVISKDKCSDHFLYYILENLNGSVNYVWLFCGMFWLLNGEMDVLYPFYTIS